MVRGDGERRRRALLAAPFGLSVMLLVGGAPFVQSLAAARRMPLGYAADRIVLLNFRFPGTTMTDEAQMAIATNCSRRRRAYPR